MKQVIIIFNWYRNNLKFTVHITISGWYEGAADSVLAVTFILVMAIDTFYKTNKLCFNYMMTENYFYMRKS